MATDDGGASEQPSFKKRMRDASAVNGQEAMSARRVAAKAIADRLAAEEELPDLREEDAEEGAA